MWRVLLLGKIYFVCRLRTGKCYFEEVSHRREVL